MMVRDRQISKLMTGILLMAGMVVLTSCKDGQAGGESTTITIQKDGTILSHIEESFEQSYYDVEELQQSILVEAAEYNKTVGSSQISVEKIDANEGMVTVRMTYQEPADYAAFNDVNFFAGTAKDVPDAYELNVVLSGVKDSTATVGKSDILAMEDYKLLIMDVSEPIYLNGRAEYVSDNVTTADDRKSVWLSGDGQGYVLYK